jgi:hypothetical protein
LAEGARTRAIRERRIATVTAESDLELLVFEAEPALEILADYAKAMKAFEALAERRKTRSPSTGTPTL